MFDKYPEVSGILLALGTFAGAACVILGFFAGLGALSRYDTEQIAKMQCVPQYAYNPPVERKPEPRKERKADMDLPPFWLPGFPK